MEEHRGAARMCLSATYVHNGRSVDFRPPDQCLQLERADVPVAVHALGQGKEVVFFLP